MKNSLKTIVVLLFIATTSCCSKKQMNQTKNNIQQEENRMSENGYNLAEIFLPSKSTCTIIIKINDERLDPINIDNYRLNKQLENNQKVYVKYKSLRRANRCKNARPIELIDLKFMNDY